MEIMENYIMYGKLSGNTIDYAVDPLVNSHVNELERSTMLPMGKSTISTGPFSKAM